MNKRKLIAALLASACVTAGAFGLAACDGCNDDTTGDTRDTQIVAVYNLYADNARANGETVLTYDEWLKTIKGENGKDGTNGKDGKSAYEIAVANGFKGTEAEWLASLKGSDGSSSNGTDGKSAYEIAVENGFEGTEAQWLESLKGSNGQDGGKGDTGVSVVSVRQVTDQWGICSYFVFTLSDDSTIDTSATPMITINRDKYYLVKNDTEKQLLISYGVMADRIEVRPITGVETRKQTIYTDNADNFMSEIYIVEKSEDNSNRISLSHVVELGGKVDISQVKADTVGEYKITGEYRGFEFEIAVTVAEKVLNGVRGGNCQTDIHEINYEGIQQALRNCWVELRYSDGSSRSAGLGGLMEDGAQIDLNGVEINSVGIYQVDGSYKGFDFTINLIVVDHENQERTLLGVILQNSNSYWVGTDENEILDSWCSVYYSNGDQEGRSLRDVGATLDGVDLTTAGEKTLSFEYEGTPCEIKIEIKEVELVYTLTGTDTASQFALAGTPVTEIKVYSNDTAKLTLSGEDEAVEAYCEMGEGLIFIGDDNGTLYLIFKYDEDEVTAFTTPTATEIAEEFDMETGETYTGTVDEKSVSVTLYVGDDGEEYSNGFVAYTVDGNTYLMMYMKQGNMLMLVGGGMFEVNAETNTITPMEMPDLG